MIGLIITAVISSNSIWASCTSQPHGITSGLLAARLFNTQRTFQTDGHLTVQLNKSTMFAHLGTCAHELYETVSVKTIERKKIYVNKYKLHIPSVRQISLSSCCQRAGPYDSKYTHSTSCEGNIEIRVLTPLAEIHFEIKEPIQSQVTTVWSHSVVFLRILGRKCTTAVINSITFQL